MKGKFVVLFLCGMISSVSLARVKLQVLYFFTGSPNASNPRAGMIFDDSGNLYGTTYAGGTGTACSGGCGTVFELLPNGSDGWNESVLHSFQGGNDGSGPQAAVTFDKTGNIYGTTVAGGLDDDGTVFELSPNGTGGWNESILHSFQSNGQDGYEPQGSLVSDSVGNLYGTTFLGGNGSCTVYGSGCGIIFELSLNSGGAWSETVLYNFQGGQDGFYPLAGLTFDSAGDLYGTTELGGVTGQCPSDAGCGTVFELIPSGSGGWSESILHSFQGGCSTCKDGQYPYAGLTIDKNGNLYGTTSSGGATHGTCGQGCGTVFELSPAGGEVWNESILYSFRGDFGGVEDGTEPESGLVFDSVGNLYGTTPYGGPPYNCGNEGCGIVYQLAPAGEGVWRERKLPLGPDGTTKYGGQPLGGVALDTFGNVYGTASVAGAVCQRPGCGTVFEITP